MKQLRLVTGMLAFCLALLTGCGEDDEATGGVNVGGSGGNAPVTLNGGDYDITEPAGTATISFTIAGRNYSLTRPGIATESGTYVANKVGNDTWDVVLSNSLDGTTSRLVLTFTGSGIGNYSFTQPNGTTINGQFRRSGFAGGGNNNGGDNGGTTNTNTNNTVTAPATLSQIVLNGRAGNPAGAGQTVINISGSTFQYAGSATSGTVTYSPNGSSAQLLLSYNGSTDFDDYTLQFAGPSGSPILSTYSGTQRVGGTPGPASGTFTYTQ